MKEAPHLRSLKLSDAAGGESIRALMREGSSVFCSTAAALEFGEEAVEKKLRVELVFARESKLQQPAPPPAHETISAGAAVPHSHSQA